MPTKHPRTKCVLFDLDNTLWDFEGNAQFALTALYQNHNLEQKLGKTASQFVEIYSEINLDFWKKFEQALIDKDTLRTRRFVVALEKMGLPEAQQPEGLWKEYLDICPTIPHLIPGALDVLQQLFLNFTIGLITNGFEETQRIKIQNSGIEPYVSFMVTSESVGHAKPKKIIFDTAVNLSGFNSKQCIYIGDNIDTDVKGGLAAGIPTAWFYRGTDILEMNHYLYQGQFNNLLDFAQFVQKLQ